MMQLRIVVQCVFIATQKYTIFTVCTFICLRFSYITLSLTLENTFVSLILVLDEINKANISSWLLVVGLVNLNSPVHEEQI